MNFRSLLVGVAAALALSACATTQTSDGTASGFPRGPALTYENLLPNTHENPAWARNPQKAPAPQAPQNAAPDAGGQTAPR